MRPRDPASYAWSDIHALNEVSLAVYDHLLLGNRHCAELLRARGHSPYLNVVAVFFHAFQRALSNHFILTYERSSGVESAPMRKRNPRRLRKLLRTAGRNVRTQLQRSMLHRWNYSSSVASVAPSVLYSENVGLNIGALRQALGESARLVPVRSTNPKLAIPELDDQLALLRPCVAQLTSTLVRSHGIPEADVARLVLTLESIVRRHTADDAQVLGCKSLVVGSLLNLQARLWAVLAKEARIPVVTVVHGEAYGVVDEPVFGYGESTYVDVMVGYGAGGWKAAQQGRYLRGLFDEVPRLVCSSAPVVQRLRTSRPIPRISDLTRRRALYVPTMLTGQDWRYGPFRDTNDAAYMHWQHRLLTALAASFDAPVGWKRHPEDRVKMEVSGVGIKAYQDALFQDVVDDFDILVFDYFSSAFSIAAATNKPIIYLDLGLRNFTGPGIEAVKERSIYVRADPLDAVGCVRQALELGDKDCVNNFSPTFSLADDRPREEVVAETLREILSAQGVPSA